jgi:hypothetical protein
MGDTQHCWLSEIPFLYATMTPYQEQFRKGTRVRIANRQVLENFQQTWKFHNPLADEQLQFADQPLTIASVGFYHGRDVLYQLVEVPGVWHECCIEAVDPTVG